MPDAPNVLTGPQPKRRHIPIRSLIGASQLAWQIQSRCVLFNRMTDPNHILQSWRNTRPVHHSWTGDVNAIPDRSTNCTTANANRIRVAFTVLSHCSAFLLCTLAPSPIIGVRVFIGFVQIPLTDESFCDFCALMILWLILYNNFVVKFLVNFLLLSFCMIILLLIFCVIYARIIPLFILILARTRFWAPIHYCHGISVPV